MQTQIRQAGLADAGEIAFCVCQAFIHYIPLIGKQPQPMLEDYQSLIKAHRVFVLCKEEKIVGVLVSSMVPDRGRSPVKVPKRSVSMPLVALTVIFNTS